VGIFLLLPVLGWGAVRFAMAMHDRCARLGDLFSGFSNYGAALGSMLVLTLVMFGVGIPADVLANVGASTKNEIYTLASFVLNLAIGWLVTPRWMFAPFLIVEDGLNAMDALHRSWELTRPQRWRMVGLLITMSVVLAAGLVCVIVGLIPATV